jgi:hypothetical protein
MNNLEEFNETILKRYLKPGKIEKAPAGFTERLMTRIRIEKVPSAVRIRRIYNYRIPLISFGTTLVLIIFAVILSPEENDTAVISILKPLSDLIKAFPKINYEKITGITIPGWFIYIMIGIFMLAVFDRALNTFFRKDRNK